jgi:hypothetical protein
MPEYTFAVESVGLRACKALGGRVDPHDYAGVLDQ